MPEIIIVDHTSNTQITRLVCAANILISILRGTYIAPYTTHTHTSTSVSIHSGSNTTVCIITSPYASVYETVLSNNTVMILPQVHLRKPPPVARFRSWWSPLFSKRLSPGQRRAVCTKGRDVINVSWWLTLTRNSSFKGNNCNSRSRSRRIFKGLPIPFENGYSTLIPPV